jgi:alpha-glucosidase
MKIKNTFLLPFIFLLLLNTKLFAYTNFKLRSPDNQIEVNITAGKAGVLYSVKVDNKQIVNPSELNIQLQDGLNICTGAILTGQLRNSNNSIWENPLGKSRHVSDHYNEITLHFEQPQNKLPFDIIFRAYNDGIAFRYRFNKLAGTDTLKIQAENSHFNFAGDYSAYMGYNQGYKFGGPQEWEFNNNKLSSIQPDSVVGLPVVIKTPAAWVAVTEADLLDWAGMWLTADANKDGSPVRLMTALAPHIHKAGCVDITTPHASPWRVLMIGRDAGKLVESNIILNLSTPSLIGKASWVKPGISAWDHWWSGGTIMTTAVIKQYIQLAADMHWPYQLIDWQWYHAFNTPNADITNVNPALNMDEVLNFAKQKGVRLWVWLYWKDVDKNDAYKKAFALYEKWGLAGVKIDFMERDDQEMVNWYEKITKCAAEHHLMVDFHGAYKPTGLERTYPNQITREGVRGNEYNIWTRIITTKHKLTLPFTRLLTGPADFTPGGFLNRQPEKFRPDSNNAEVQGTRTAQLALFVIYNSPYTVACDRPEHYYNQPGADFLQIVPTTWDETHVLKGEIADYLIEARRKGNDWFIGAMTNENARQFNIPLNFLSAGKYKITIWQDAADSGENAEHLDKTVKIVSRLDHLNINMVRNGGYVAHIEKL